MRKIKVLHFGALSPTKGGIESYIISQLRAIDREQIQYDFLVPEDSPPLAYEDEVLALGSTIHRRFFAMGQRSSLYQITHAYRRFTRLYRFFREHPSYDAVVCNLLSLPSIDVLIFARLFHVPIRIAHSHQSLEQTRHSVLFRLLVRLNKKILPCFATHLFACAEVAGSWMFGANWTQDKIPHAVVNNAIDTDRFIYNEQTRARIRQELGLKDELIIGHTGRMAPPKNQSFVVRVFSEIHRLRPDTRLVFLGDGVDMPKVKALAHELGLDGAVLFLGERSNVAEFLQAMDVFLFPSEWEGLSLSLVEAQTAGLKTFTTLDRVSPETKITELLEFIPLDDNPELWAHRILESLPYERQNMQSAIASAGFDARTTAASMLDFFKRELER